MEGLRVAAARPRDAAALGIAAIQIEQENRAEDGKDQSTRGADQEPRDDAADQGPAEAEAERRVPGHRVRSREREPGEPADDEAPDDQAEEEEHYGERSMSCLRTNRMR